MRLRDGVVTIRPLAGTRPRGATPEEDAALEADLLSDPKERAEHLMLVDLGRNDVGRVARIGTVRVTESFAVERFSQVMWRFANTRGGGSTPMSDGIQYAMMALSQRDEAHRFLFVVTDGCPNGDHVPVIQRQKRLAKAADDVMKEYDAHSKKDLGQKYYH